MGGLELLYYERNFSSLYYYNEYNNNIKNMCYYLWNDLFDWKIIELSHKLMSMFTKTENDVITSTAINGLITDV